MWGNSPEFTQKEFEKGNKPTEQWLNPDAQKLMGILGGTKPSSGWNGRMNGPGRKTTLVSPIATTRLLSKECQLINTDLVTVDNFISACASCHSLAQKSGESRLIFRPKPVQLPEGRWVPQDDEMTMLWFRNVPAGKPFTKGGTSGDYCLQLMRGWQNYQDWRNSSKCAVTGKKFALSGETIQRREKEESNSLTENAKRGYG